MNAPCLSNISKRSPYLLGLAIFISVNLLSLTINSSAVLAQSNNIQDTLKRLETQLQTLERSVYRNSPPPKKSPVDTSIVVSKVPPPAVSQLQLKSSELEEQIRGITGQIEELGFKMTQVKDRLDRLVADVDFRLRTLETSNIHLKPEISEGIQKQNKIASTSQTNSDADIKELKSLKNSVKPGTLGTLTESQIESAKLKQQQTVDIKTEQKNVSKVVSSVLPVGSLHDRYKYAFNFLKRRDFEGAEKALKAFVEAYPGNELSGNAQYWLGETYYVRKNYAAAANVFAEGFKRYPKSNKAPDNLLKLGMSLSALERIQDACITFNKLDKEYPNSKAAIKQRYKKELIRLNCE
jgi:tol-pal system protein YbgF